MNATLRQIQEQFQSYVIKGNEEIKSQIKDCPQITIQQRVDIYRDGYYLRLIDILQREFTVLVKVLGAEAFDKLCRNYIDAYPSTHFSVKTFGRHMMKFLTTYPGAEKLHVELALFEWEFGKVLEDADAPQLTLADMAQIPPDAWADMRMRLHPSLRLLDLHYNTPDVWRAWFDDAEPVAIEHSETATTWMLWRFTNMTHYRPLTPSHLYMLRAVQNNASFAEICEGLCAYMSEEEVAEFTGCILQEWLGQGLVSALVVANEV